ncbi:MAG: TonB-dependent receptor, partial [Bacteroidales bacterium]|nr:TonB-dependent receptor [Bacteroidales bacterium]
NVGKVVAWGADLLAGVAYEEGDWKACATARYGFQKALDKTPDSYTFDQQIPYVARHTVTADASLGWKGWSLQAVFNLRCGRADAGGDMPSWNTLDLSAGKEFTFGNGLSVAAKVIARNLTGTRYEIIRDYPMPGRSLLGGLEFRF